MGAAEARPQPIVPPIAWGGRLGRRFASAKDTHVPWVNAFPLLLGPLVGRFKGGQGVHVPCDGVPQQAHVLAYHHSFAHIICSSCVTASKSLETSTVTMPAPETRLVQG